MSNYIYMYLYSADEFEKKNLKADGRFWGWWVFAVVEMGGGGVRGANGVGRVSSVGWTIDV